MGGLIQNKSDLKDWLSYKREKKGNIRSTYWLLAVSETDIIWRYQRRLRITEYYKNTGKKIRLILSKLLLNKMSIKYGMSLPLNGCGRGLKIMHLGSILCNGKVIIGENCTLHINTAIVAGGRNNATPILGNGIVVGVGAIILGDTVLADNIAIGANSLVNKSFNEPNIAIAGVPAKKISDNGRLTWSDTNKN